MPPALAALTLSPDEVTTAAADVGQRLVLRGILPPDVPTRGVPGQIVAGIQRGAFGVGATFGDALGVLFPDTGKGITDFFKSYQMQSSGGMIEQAAETATQSLGVLGAAALGLSAGGVPALTGLGVGTLSAIATPAVFGLAQATQTRDLLHAINQEVTKRGGRPLTSGEIAAAMATNGAIEFGGEFISDILFAKRFFPGSTAFQGAKDAVRAYLVNPEVNAAVRLVARATEESVRAGVREAPEEFIQNLGEAAVTRGIVGPERLRQAQEAGIQVPGAPLEEGFQAAKVALLAGPFFAAGGAASARLLRGRQTAESQQAAPQGQPAGDVSEAAMPPTTPAPAPIVAPLAEATPARPTPSLPGRMQGPGFEMLDEAEAARTRRQIAGATIPQPPGAPSRQRAAMLAQTNPDEYLEMTGRIGASVDTATLMQEELFPITIQAFQQGLRPNDIADPQRRQQFLNNLEAAWQFYQEPTPPLPPPPAIGSTGAPLVVTPETAMPTEALLTAIQQTVRDAGVSGRLALPAPPSPLRTQQEIAGFTPVLPVPALSTAPPVVPESPTQAPLPSALEAGLRRRDESPPTLTAVQAARRQDAVDFLATGRAPHRGMRTFTRAEAMDAFLIHLAEQPEVALNNLNRPGGFQGYVRWFTRAGFPRREAQENVGRGFDLLSPPPAGGTPLAIPERFARAPVIEVRPRVEAEPVAPPAHAQDAGLPGTPQDEETLQALRAPADVTAPIAGPAEAVAAPLPVAQQAMLPDLVSALRNLGYTQRDATTVAQEALAQHPASLEEAIGVALRPQAERISRTAAPAATPETAPAQAPQEPSAPTPVSQPPAREMVPEAQTTTPVAPTAAQAAQGEAAPVPVQPSPGQQTLVDTSQLAEQERATQAQITREGVEAEAGTRLRPTVEQAPPSGLFEQEQALPFGPGAEAEEAAGHLEARGDEIQTAIRKLGGINARAADIATELLAVTRPAETGTTRLLNRNGMTADHMAQELNRLGYLREPSIDELKQRLDASLRGIPQHQDFAPGGLFETPGSLQAIPGGNRADASAGVRRQAAAIPERLEHVATGETIVAVAFQPEPGRTVTLPGVRRREGTVEIARAIAPNEVIDELHSTGSVAFMGKTIRAGQAGSRDIAVFGELARDPQEEHLHYLFGREDGTVGLVYEVGSRLPGSAAPFVKEAGQPLIPGAMAAWLKTVQQIMREGAYTTLRMVHNHPSGDPSPSSADVLLTKRLAAAIPGFQGHTVIDSGRFAHITPTGEVTVEALETGKPDPFLQPSLGAGFAQVRLQTTEDAAAIGRALAQPTFVTMLLLNKPAAGTGLRIRGALLVPEQALLANHGQVQTYVESLQREFGAPLAVTYYNGSNLVVNRTAEHLYAEGILHNHVAALPQGMEISLAEEVPGLRIPQQVVEGRRIVTAPGIRVMEPSAGVAEAPPGLAVPTTIEGVSVDQAGKLATAYRMLFDVGQSLHSSHIQQPLSQATFQKLRIRWDQMEEMGQQRMLRFMQHPEELDALRQRLQRDPTAGLSTAENAGLVQWSMVMLDDLDVKRGLGEIDQATFDQEWDAIIKNALLIPAAASSAGRTLAMQRRFQQVGSYTITDFLRREERARGRALTDDEKRQAVGDFLDIIRTGDRDQIRAAMERQTDPTLLDYYWEAYYGSLLSGLPTHAINTLGTLAHITFHKFVVGPTAVGLDWMISGFSGQERQRYMREVFADFNATWKNAGQQYRDAWYWWKSPFPQAMGGEGALAQQTGALREGAAITRGGMRLDAGSGAEAWARAPTQHPDGTPNDWGPVMRRLAPFVGAASRGMAAMDAVATNLAFQGEVAKVATREGIRQFGLQDRQQVDNFVEHVQTHLVQYPEIEAAAKAGAQSDTFNDPAGKLASVLTGLRRAPQPFGFFFHLLTPFAGTPDRLLARGAELVPVLGLPVGYREAGYTGRTGFAGNFRGWLADFRQGEPQAVEVAAKQVVGLMLSSMAALLWDKDLLTGPLPTDPQERQAWERQGKLPFAIRMGNNWVEYRRVEPFISAPFGALTAGLQAIKTMRDERLKQGLTLDYSYMDDASSVAAGIALNMTKFVLDSSYFNGLASFFADTSRSSQGFATGLTQQLVSATLPLSGLLRNLNRTIEASGMLGTEPGVVLMRQREGVGEQFMRSIPGAAAAVPPRLDVFGQPVVSERPLLGAVGGLLSPIRRQVAQEDPVEAAFERLHYRPGRPPRRQLETVVGRRIEDEEYDNYTQRRGELARDTIERIVSLPFFGELPQDKQLARLKQAFSQATRRARREVFGRPETTQERRTRFAEAELAAASGE